MPAHGRFALTHGALMGLVVMLGCCAAPAAVIYECDFEDGSMPGWRIPEGREPSRVEIARRQEGGPTFGDSACSLRLTGPRIWNLADLKLPEPLALDQPVYLVCALRSEGPASQVGLALLIEGRPKPVLSSTGRVGRRALGRWERVVARLDWFDPEIEGEKLLGVRFSQRCTVGAELPDRQAPEHELLLDDVRILTPPDAEQAEAIAREEGGPREYLGPERFVLRTSERMAVWHSPSLAPVLKDSSIPEATGEAVRITAARREAESFQLVATLTEPAHATLTLEPSPLVGPGEASIPTTAIKWHPVRYVPLKARLGQSLELQWPDPLSWDREVSVEQARHVPFWVTVHVPADARPGVYRGSLMLKIEGDLKAAVEVPVEVEVLDFELPFRPSFRTNQQIWGAVRGEMRPWLEELAERKMFDGNMWYSLEEEQVWRMEELGQNTIKVNLVGGHGTRVTKYGDHEMYTPEYDQAYLERAEKLLESVRRHGWEKSAFVYVWDENWGSMEVFDMVAHLAGLIRQVSPEVPVLGALPVHPKIEGLVNIYLAEYSPPEVIERRMKQGDEFWRWGNVDLQLGKAPMTTRLSYGFESVRRKFTGAYSWGVSSWSERDPWTDLDRNNWGGSFFYPGGHEGSRPDRPVPSIRMELLRDGIEDYEYAAILRRLMEQAQEASPARAAQARRLLERADALCEVPAERRRCDEGVDELIQVRRLMQEAIIALSEGQ